MLTPANCPARGHVAVAKKTVITFSPTLVVVPVAMPDLVIESRTRFSKLWLVQCLSRTPGTSVTAIMLGPSEMMHVQRAVPFLI
jgi:hypothetical protein